MDTLVKKKRLVLYATMISIISLCHFNSNAQIVLPKDEAGKITYLEVIKKDSIPTDSIFKRVIQWTKFTYAKSKMTIDTSAKRIVTRERFLVYTKPGVLKEIHGAIRYDIAVEVKENRYRYTFTNFVFEYYKQDRNYNYVPAGKEKPLEEEKFPGWQAAWEKHKYTTDTYIKEKIEDLNKSIENKKPETKVIQPVKKNQDW